MKWLILFALCYCPVLAEDWYVSPSGTGNGTAGNPGSLLVAGFHTNWAASIAPGDTIYLKSGVYSNSLQAPQQLYNGGLWGDTNWNWSRWYVEFSGSAGNYITWRSAPGEWAKIDGGWKFNTTQAAYHRFRDLEFYQSSKANQTNATGIFQTNRLSLFSSDHTTVSNEFINCVIHDCGNVWDGTAAGRSVRGCIIWYAGSTLLEHVIYSTAYEVHGNIIGWTSGQNMQGNSDFTTVSSNLMFAPGVSIRSPYRQISSHAGANIWGNYFYGQGNNNSGLHFDTPYGKFINVSNNVLNAVVPFYFNDPASNATVRITGNTAVGQIGKMINRDDVSNLGTWLVNFNAYFAPTNSVYFDDNFTTKTFAQWQAAYGYDANSTSANSTLPADSVMVVPNRDEAKRAHIGIYNWASNHNVSVSLSGVLVAGDSYRLYSAQNYAGAIQTGTYNGTSISVPMTNLTTAPILYGWSGIVDGTNYSALTQPGVTSPQFAAFVLVGGSSAGVEVASFGTLNVQ